MMIDIDDFKQVNDQYGHHWGDAVLREIARILKQKTRKSDILVRYGGDEFTLMLPEASIAVALQTADKLRTEIKAAIFRQIEEHTSELQSLTNLVCRLL